MALTLSLDHSMSVGGARLQTWSITSDGTKGSFATGLKRVIAVWGQSKDDTITGTSFTHSAGTVSFGAKMTSTKVTYVFVLGE